MVYDIGQGLDALVIGQASSDGFMLTGVSALCAPTPININLTEH
jgi:hypothetical protein